MPEGDAGLSITDVTQVFSGHLGRDVRAVDGVSLGLSAAAPRITSPVGASGSGKSTIGRIMLGLQRPTSGRVTYRGQDIWHLGHAEYVRYRSDVQPVFQDPYAVFNPIYRVDRLFWKTIKKFRLARGRRAGLAKIEASLAAVQLVPDDVLGRFAHQLSGGQRQRLMLARIHMMQPSFVIADEPVSMLDAQVRRSFLDIMVDFQQKYHISTLFITHDLSTVAYVGGDMITLFKGRIVETGKVKDVLANPAHPYTKLLVDSVPIPDPDRRWTDRIELVGGEPRGIEEAAGEGAGRGAKRTGEDTGR